ncbi:unnamed protein product [Pieris brassicae]|uniref:Uncharacterized protein n=1 Tax=Pieris brassicae TaxID=7116 RepID=A0A9P0XEE0_PIEBR|nr:unnamed protein product [Pieris brassicae]
MKIISSKCCFCLPIRTGLLIICYLKIAICTIISLFMLSNRLQSLGNPDDNIFKYIVLGIIAVLEFCFSIVLITGIHKKHFAIVRVTYVYNVLMMGIQILIAIIYVPLQTYELFVTERGDDPILMLIAAILLVVVLQLYVASLVRRQLVHMRQQCVSDPNSSTYSPRKPYVVY